MAQAYVWFKDIKKNYPPLYNAFHRYFLAHYKAENLLKYLESQLENKKKDSNFIIQGESLKRCFGTVFLLFSYSKRH